MSTKQGLYLTVFICSMLWASCSPRGTCNPILVQDKQGIKSKPRIIKNIELENEITCSIRFSKDTLIAGELFTAYFVVSNHSNQSIYFDNCPRGYFIDGKKAGGFDVMIEKENGEILVPEGLVLGMGQGRCGIVETAPKKTEEIRIELQDYRFTSGKYQLTVSKKLGVFLDKKKDRRRRRNNDRQDFKKIICSHKTVSTSLLITVPKN